MQEKKSDSANKNPKKANLLDPHSIKHTLDESVTEIVTGRGYVEDVRLSNVRLFLGTIIIAIALFAQFYKKKFPENRDFLILCIVLYIVFNAVLQLIIFTKEKNAILFTYPPAVMEFPGYMSVVAFFDHMLITEGFLHKHWIGGLFQIAKILWFTKDGVLVEGLFWKDVEALINEYQREPKKSK